MPPAGFVMSHPTCKNSPGHPPSGQGFLCMTWEWVGRGPNQFVHSSFLSALGTLHPLGKVGRIIKRMC